MSTIVIQDPDKRIDKETFERLDKKNGAGIGFCFVKENKSFQMYKVLSCSKGYEWYDNFCRGCGKYTKLYMVFRSTKKDSTKNIKYLYPFKITKNIAFINGGCDVDFINNKDDSNTWYLNEYILKYLSENFTDNEFVMEMIKNYMGNTAPVVFINSEKETCTILNEWRGTTINGIYYSDDKYKEIKPTNNTNFNSISCDTCSSLITWDDSIRISANGTMYYLCKDCAKKMTA